MQLRQVLYPADFFKPKLVDESYRDEASALGAKGWSVSTIKQDLSTPEIVGELPAGESVLYRGWMLDQDQYQALEGAVERLGARLFTNLETYLSTHYIPNWYKLLPECTSETVFLDVNSDLEAELEKMGWDGFFVKDYVKSLKTSVGSILRDPGDVRVLIAEMAKFRGQIEGGLSIRRLEDYREGTERRYFCVNGAVFASDSADPPDVALVAAGRISSPFFSIDVAERNDGTLRIVEIGDGQVSDLVGWDLGRFVEVLQNAA